MGTFALALKRLLPARVWQTMRSAVGRPVWPPEDHYRALYEAHSREHPAEDVSGAGSFDVIGKMELALLLKAGVRPTDTVLDFGCGVGRLAVQLVPFLKGGHYIGTDIAQAILDRARQRLAPQTPKSDCKITLLRQESERFPSGDSSVDMLCAYSVFTHMEHEDAWRYLVDARRIIRPGGRFVFSCLTLDQPTARNTFLVSSADSFQARWSKVRNVTTSRDMMNALAEMTGWIPIQWFAGDEPNILIAGADKAQALGQSVCILAPK